MTILPEDLFKVFFALLLGGVIGIEREFRDKAAGFRTMIFICVGATLFTILSSKLAGIFDPARIAANIVVGVGFLGAGVILRDSGGRVTGMTTAATIWLTAAIGTGVGAGDYVLSTVVAVISVVVLWLFPRLEVVIDRTHSERIYEITTLPSLKKFEELEANFKTSGLRVRRHRQSKMGEHLVSTWFAGGHVDAHQKMTELLLSDPGIIEFKS